MKIIERGTNTVKCERCGCLMEYERNDIKSKIVQVHTSLIFWSLTSPSEVEYVVCPQCGKEVSISRCCCM